MTWGRCVQWGAVRSSGRRAGLNKNQRRMTARRGEPRIATQGTASDPLHLHVTMHPLTFMSMCVAAEIIGLLIGGR